MNHDEEIIQLKKQIELLSAYVEQSLGVIANASNETLMDSLYNINEAYCNLINEKSNEKK